MSERVEENIIRLLNEAIEELKEGKYYASELSITYAKNRLQELKKKERLIILNKLTNKEGITWV